MEYNDSFFYNYSYGSCLSYNYSIRNFTHMADEFLYSDSEIILHRFVLPVILLVGITTNCAFLFVVYRIPSMRTVVNQYLTHIAVGDLLFLITAIGKKLLRFSASKNKFDTGTLWPHWMEICSHVVNYTTIFASVLIMTLVGFERFYAVCRPMRLYAATTSQTMVKVLLAVVWVLSAFLALTTIPSISMVTTYCVVWPDDPRFDDMGDVFDTYHHRSKVALAYTSLVQTVPFFVVMVINSVLYVKMVLTMSGRLGTMQAHDLDTQRNIDLRNKVAVMLIINGVTFFTLTFPFQLVSFVIGMMTLFKSNHTSNSITSDGMKTFLQMLLYCNSLINPIIYNAANSRYRSAFVTAFGIDKMTWMRNLFVFRPRDYSTPLGNGKNKESPTKNTVTTTYSNSYTTAANGDILLESDTKC